MSAGDETIAFAFAAVLRAAVRNSGLSEIALTERADLPERTLRELQTASSEVTLAQLFRIADALEVHWVDLVTEVRARASGLVDASIPPRVRNAWLADPDDAVTPVTAPQNAPVPAPCHDPRVVDLIRFARSLPTDTRRVFTLRKVYGLSHRDIAAHLSMSITTVQSHLVQALIRLDKLCEPKANAAGQSSTSI